MSASFGMASALEGERDENQRSIHERVINETDNAATTGELSTGLVVPTHIRQHGTAAGRERQHAPGFSARTNTCHGLDLTDVRRVPGGWRRCDGRGNIANIRRDFFVYSREFAVRKSSISQAHLRTGRQSENDRKREVSARETTPRRSNRVDVYTKLSIKFEEIAGR